MGLAVFLSRARAAVSSGAHHTTYSPPLAQKKKPGKKKKNRGSLGCTVDAQEALTVWV